MYVIANPYTLGSTSVNFELTFGNGDIVNNKVSTFTPVTKGIVTLSGDDISNWGTDDTYILNKIALNC
jgi:hypothetical protein